MRVREAISDIGTGMIGGYVGTKVMERVSTKLYEWESEKARQQEDEVRPGDPPILAARKTTQWLGLELSEEQIQAIGLYLFHYGLGMSWGAVYTLLRRRTGLDPVPAGLLTGAAMSLLVDEGLTPLLGFSAPNRAYPLVTTCAASWRIWCSGWVPRVPPRPSTGWVATGSRRSEPGGQTS